MNVKEAYNFWAQQYDTNTNATRDLEHVALQTMLAPLQFNKILEAGCGTGKNTEWLATKCESLTGIDFSEEMLAKAERKTLAFSHIKFKQVDLQQPWPLDEERYDLITFSLVLEHIQQLEFIFKQAALFLQKGGIVYVGELHPFKQYSGSKARFETSEGLQVVECFTHNISDFIQAAKRNGLMVTDLQEFFDNEDKATLPRVLSLLFKKL